MLFLLSVLSFALIQLPPGSYLEFYVSNLESQGLRVDEAQIHRLKQQYGLDQPIYVQYYRWMYNFLTRGDLGRSMGTAQGSPESGGRPVTEILMERIPLTMIISLISLTVVWIVAIPIGVFSATNQYSLMDYIATVIGFIGLALPNFLFAIVIMWFVFAKTGHAVTGLFSMEYYDAPWSLLKFIDMLKNIWIPVLVLATAGTAGLIRVMRANMLDELNKQYVVTARAKGLSERRLLWKYPIRIAFNPIISTIGWLLPAIVGGEALVAIILNLRTVGPVLLRAVLRQDMYLAGSIVMILSTLTVIGTLISDLALLWLDPRIRYE
jgi:peptide/nickel transport system permease protein